MLWVRVRVIIVHMEHELHAILLLSYCYYMLLLFISHSCYSYIYMCCF